jgi:hypothetical protein
MRDNKKAQIWYMDLVIAIGIFVVILIITFRFISTDYVSTEKKGTETFFETEKLSEYLLSPGIPERWNESSVVIIGITSGENVLNISKLEMLKDLTNNDYEHTKFGFGFNSEFLIYFVNKEGVLLNLINQTFIGKSNYTNESFGTYMPSHITSIERFLAYKHDGVAEIIGMRVIGWQE